MGTPDYVMPSKDPNVIKASSSADKVRARHDRHDQTKTLGKSQPTPLAPGQKQPAHKDEAFRAQDTLRKLEANRVDMATQTQKSSAERAKSPGNLNPIPPHERKPVPGPAQTAAADIATGHLAAAESAIIAQETAQAALESDPRYERDQKVYELGQTGKLGKVPPTTIIPESPEEQVADDMDRLQVGEDRAALGPSAVAARSRIDDLGVVRTAEDQTRRQTIPSATTRAATIRPGDQENAPRNNLLKDAKGRTLGGAEGESQAQEQARKDALASEQTASGTVIK